VKEAIPLDEQSDFVAMPMRSSVVAPTMNPEAEEWDEEVVEELQFDSTKLSKAAMSILEDLGVSGDDDDEEEDEEDLTDDGPSLWNRNG